MNAFKAVICWIALALAIAILGRWTRPSDTSAWAFAVSGIVGLGIADIFLLAAYTRIGAARTLMLFGFQPVFIGTASSILFGQGIEPIRLIAIVFFILCLFILSFERYKQEGRWEILGLSLALAGVILDNSGVIITRWGFDHSPGVDPLTANLYRTTGALAAFALIGLVRPFGFVRIYRSLSARDRMGASLAAFVGTFMSLALYLTALQHGHLASIAAIGLTGPLISACLECVMERKRPSVYLLGGILCMMTGMLLFFSASYL